MLQKQNINFLLATIDQNLSFEISNIIKTMELNLIHSTQCAKSTIQTIKEQDIDFAIIDVILKGSIDGLMCAKDIKNSFQTKLILISDIYNQEILSETIDISPEYFYLKPLKLTDFKTMLILMLSKYQKETKSNKNITLKQEVTEITIERYTLNIIKQKLYLDTNYEIPLTKKEYKLTQLFFQHPNEIISYEKIEKYIWGDKIMNKNSLINIIGSLRRKLEYIKIINQNGEGYYIKYYYS